MQSATGRLMLSLAAGRTLHKALFVMPLPLTYAHGEPVPKSAAMGSLIFGISSGPLSVAALFMMASVNEPAALAISGGVLLTSAIYAIIVRAKLPAALPSSHRWIATFGVLFPLAYGCLFFTLMCASVQE
jgi:hypothetical protein